MFIATLQQIIFQIIIIPYLTSNDFLIIFNTNIVIDSLGG